MEFKHIGAFVSLFFMIRCEMERAFFSRLHFSPYLSNGDGWRAANWVGNTRGSHSFQTNTFLHNWNCADIADVGYHEHKSTKQPIKPNYLKVSTVPAHSKLHFDTDSKKSAIAHNIRCAVDAKNIRDDVMSDFCTAAVCVAKCSVHPVRLRRR